MNSKFPRRRSLFCRRRCPAIAISSPAVRAWSRRPRGPVVGIKTNPRRSRSLDRAAPDTAACQAAARCGAECHLQDVADGQRRRAAGLPPAPASAVVTARAAQETILSAFRPGSWPACAFLRRTPPHGEGHLLLFMAWVWQLFNKCAAQIRLAAAKLKEMMVYG